MSKEAYYFSHDANARQDPKILAMMSVYGAEGYGWYWIIVEMLREQSDFTLDMQGKYTFNAIAMQMHCNKDTSEKFVHDCIYEFELFETNGEIFWSNSLLRRMAMKEEISQKRKKAAEKRWGKKQNDADGMQMHSTSNAGGMQGKEKKVNKIKESINTVFHHWLSKGIIDHKKITSPMETAINARLKDYSIEEIIKAIDNYSVVYKEDGYWFSHKYTLADFMRDKDIRKFLDESEPLNNFRKNKQQQNNKQVDWEDL